MKLIYFAWLRDRIGLSEEQVDAPAEVRNVGDLLAWLKTRSPGHAEALANLSIVKVAVNQDYAGADQILAPDDEVALFPPVTGG
ncbi:MAG: sulfur-carrier protein [Aliidongia sp.]|jgi:molybdopterin synthase sulfur carrier subunit|nr:sulfur-carrier protein [Aliidongia sp.]